MEHNRLTSLPLCLGQRSGLCVLRLGHNSLQQLDFLLPSNRHVGAGIARGGIAGGDFDSSTMGLLKLHTLEAQCNELTEVSVITRTLAHSHAHTQMSLFLSLSLSLSVRACVCVCCIHVCMYLYINEIYVDGRSSWTCLRACKMLLGYFCAHFNVCVCVCLHRHTSMLDHVLKCMLHRS